MTCDWQTSRWSDGGCGTAAGILLSAGGIGIGLFVVTTSYRVLETTRIANDGDGRSLNVGFERVIWIEYWGTCGKLDLETFVFVNKIFFEVD